MSKPIKEIINALDKNIKCLEEVEEINISDVKTLLIDLFGTMRDLWVKLDSVFGKFDELNAINEATEKGENYEEKISDDVERLYQ